MDVITMPFSRLVVWWYSWINKQVMMKENNPRSFSSTTQAIYKSKCMLILYLTEELHDAYTDNSVKKRSPVYNSTALTDSRSVKNILVVIM